MDTFAAPPTLVPPAPGFGPVSRAAAPVAPPAGPDFGAMLAEAVTEVNAHATAADGLTTRALLGENMTQAEVFTAVRKADLSLRMLVEVRNKLVEAWQQLQNVTV